MTGMTKDASLGVGGLRAGLLRLATWLDLVNAWVGRVIAWLALAMVLVTFLVVVLRYGLDQGSIALQESVTYMHAVLFMLGAAFTLQRNAHVRVDIFYQRFPPRARAWVDLLGTLVLLAPICLFILASSWGYVSDSWAVKEGSREAGGLPYVYWLKTLLLLMPALLLLQGVVWMLRSGLFLAGVAAAAPAEAASGRAVGGGAQHAGAGAPPDG